jgi:hypothetical protein
VNMIATALYFILRMLQYQYQAEREAWVHYVRTIEQHVFDNFGSRIGGDLSLLHQPIAAALRIYNAAFEDTRHVERRHLKRLLAVKEEGLLRNTNAELAVTQPNTVTESIELFMRCIDTAQARMKLLLEPQISKHRFKSAQWDTGEAHERPTGVPSALFVVDPGVKGADAVLAQAHYLYRGRLDRSTNAARLKLVFANCEALLQGLAALRDVFEVVGLINGFASPSPMGMRALYLVVKVPIDIPRESVEDDRATVSARFPLAHLQLQLLRYDLAQQEAAPQDQLFVERLPAVCHQLDPKDQPFVQEMIAELMRTFRPSSSIPRSPSKVCSYCFRRQTARPVHMFGKSDNLQSSTIDTRNSSRKAFTSAVRVVRPAVRVVRRVTARTSGDTPQREDLEVPLLDEDDEGVGVSDEAGGESQIGGDQSQDVYHQHSAAADTVWYDLRWVLEFEQSKQLLLQDLLVLTKTLAASIALFFVTCEGQLIKCEGVNYSAHERHDCRLSSGAVQEQVRVVRGAL